jgi:hypothetical protein
MMLPVPAAAVGPAPRGGAKVATAVSNLAPAGSAHGAKGCGFHQLDRDSGVAYPSADFLDDGFDQYDSTGADDFICKRSVNQLRRITIIGSYYGGTGPGESIDIVVRSNDTSGSADEPTDSKIACSFPDMPINESEWRTVVVQPKGIPCRLKAGRVYWLEAEMNIYFESHGQWGWEAANAITANAADWRNPDDGFETGCASYSAAGSGGDRDTKSCLQRDELEIDFMFAVR